MRASICFSWMILFCTALGCSSTGGFSLWPPHFPLLKQTKELASQTPVKMCLPRELSQQPVQAYFVEPGDRILIEPFDLESDFDSVGDQLVQVDGSVDLGSFGRLRVAGLTVEMIEAAITDQVIRAGGEHELFNVQLIEANAALFYVLGEVGSPGAYELAGRELLLDGILRAGGLTSKASACNIILVRPTGPCDERVVLPVCYRQITQLGDSSTNYQLQPGDRIVVASRTLCEELAFWRQSKSCRGCNKTQCPNCNPCSVHYDNRFTRWLAQFPLPPLLEDDAPRDNLKTDAEEDVSASSPGSEASDPQPSETRSILEPLQPEIPTQPESTPQAPADEEFYLPPLKPKQQA